VLYNVWRKYTDTALFAADTKSEMRQYEEGVRESCVCDYIANRYAGGWSFSITSIRSGGVENQA
jgi:hypothetical protein